MTTRGLLAGQDSLIDPALHCAHTHAEGLGYVLGADKGRVCIQGDWSTKERSGRRRQLTSNDRNSALYRRLSLPPKVRNCFSFSYLS
jgi:hypothetical protein